MKINPIVLVGPALILMSCAAALAQDPLSAMAAQQAQSNAAVGAAMSPQDYLMALGPFGALVWGAFMLGRGVNLTLSVKLDDGDRKLVERGVAALEKK